AGRFDPLDAARLSIAAATVSAADLDEFVHTEESFRHGSLTLDEGAGVFALGGPGPTLRAPGRVPPAPDRPVPIAAERVSIGGVPVPSLIVDWLVRNFDPSPRLAARLPFPVELGAVTVTRDAVRITSAHEATAR